MTPASKSRPAPRGGFLERRFGFRDRRTDVRTELLGGVATFLTMSYILFVHPAILSAAGLPFGAVAVATAIAACVATLAMGLLTNLPFALAPGLGINAVVAFDIVLGRGVEWPVAMAIIVIEGLIALILVIAGLRGAIMRAVPLSLKLAIGVGIGLFITLVGLREGGIVVNNPATGIGLGDLTSGPALVALAGIAVGVVLIARGVRGAVIITHGRAKRRMIEHAVRVGATTARERVPERIAEALAADALVEAQAGHAAHHDGLPRPASDVDEALAAIETETPATDGDRVVAREGS